MFFFLQYIPNHLPHDVDACPVLRLAVVMHTYLVQQFAPECLQAMQTQSDGCLNGQLYETNLYCNINLPMSFLEILKTHLDTSLCNLL